ncbi:unnamed protein product [Bursaphelenchus okinawaensis]|uniref:Tyrosine-protein kinase n=1 Tax=Bursaphelenchus okinawaensis TaxID=465554 RepID=A0A811K3J8_9BILA|nr:unnamed protein product [Bursaphelenchus okinawaensis]CAG9091498.1 unnamed protein product [Bursaphelenchus okinawaensis]
MKTRKRSDDLSADEKTAPKPSVRTQVSQYQKNSGALKLLEDEPWFHGFTPKRAVEKKLGRLGDWLVRTTESRRKTEIVISVLSDGNKIINYSIAYSRSSKKWYLGILEKKPVLFDTVTELIEHYRTHRLPGIKFKLNRERVREPWHIERSRVEYDPDKGLLGAGNFGRVYKGKLKAAKGSDQCEEVAIKISVDNGKKDRFENKAKKDLHKEGLVLSNFDHANVIKFYGMILTKPPYMVILEFCPGGALLDHLTKQEDKITVGERILYLYEAAKGMNYLHRHQYTHRDLAARNCLISRDGTIKIADFGLSQHIQTAPDNYDKDVQIPLRWMAPESLTKKPKFGTASDMWSYAVFIFEVFSNGAKPWPEEEHRRIAGKIRRCQMMEMPKSAPVEVVKFAKTVWKLNPMERPTFPEALPVMFRLHNERYPPPAPEECTVNKLKGVIRCPFDKGLEPDYNHPVKRKDAEDESEQESKFGTAHENTTTTSTYQSSEMVSSEDKPPSKD